MFKESFVILTIVVLNTISEYLPNFGVNLAMRLCMIAQNSTNSLALAFRTAIPNFSFDYFYFERYASRVLCVFIAGCLLTCVCVGGVLLALYASCYIPVRWNQTKLIKFANLIGSNSRHRRRLA